MKINKEKPHQSGVGRPTSPSQLQKEFSITDPNRKINRKESSIAGSNRERYTLHLPQEIDPPPCNSMRNTEFLIILNSCFSPGEFHSTSSFLSSVCPCLWFCYSLHVPRHHALLFQNEPIFSGKITV